ncbi:MAG: hypothetical protein ABMB14_03240 [Myxococcota bacterium]
MFAVWLAVSAGATEAEPVHPGEFYGYFSGWTGTAYTTPRGELALHPSIRSSWGVAKFLDLKASLVGEVFKPHLGAELAFAQGDAGALSVEAKFAAPWGGGLMDYGVVPHASVHLGENLLLDASVGIHGLAGSQAAATTGSLGGVSEPGLEAVRPELSLDVHVADPTWVVLTVRSDVYGWATTRVPQGVAGIYGVYGKKAIGVSGGLNVALLGLGGVEEELATLEELGVSGVPDLPTAVPVPLPQFQLWFRI